MPGLNSDEKRNIQLRTENGNELLPIGKSQPQACNFFTFGYVNNDGMGDLTHWMDHDIFLKKKLGDKYRPLRVVLCHEDKFSACYKRLRDCGYPIVASVLDDEKIDSRSDFSAVRLIKVDFDATCIRLGFDNRKRYSEEEAKKVIAELSGKGIKSITTVSIIQTVFSDFCKQVEPDLLKQIEHFLFISILPFNLRSSVFYAPRGADISDFHSFDLELLKKDFPRAKWIALPEHGCPNEVSNEIHILRMGFGINEYGLKLNPVKLPTLTNILENIADEKLNGFFRDIQIKEDALFVPIYFKNRSSLLTLIQAISSSKLAAKASKVVFCVSGCGIDQDDYKSHLRYLECKEEHDLQFVTPDMLPDKNKKFFVLSNWNINSADYQLLLQLGALGGIGGCAGDNSFENLLSLKMLPIYDIPSMEKMNTLFNMLESLSLGFQWFFKINILLSHAEKTFFSFCPKDRENKFNKVLEIFKVYFNIDELLAEWKAEVEKLLIAYNYQAHLVHFLNEISPGLFSLEDVKATEPTIRAYADSAMAFNIKTHLNDFAFLNFKDFTIFKGTENENATKGDTTKYTIKSLVCEYAIESIGEAAKAAEIKAEKAKEVKAAEAKAKEAEAAKAKMVVAKPADIKSIGVISPQLSEKSPNVPSIVGGAIFGGIAGTVTGFFGSWAATMYFATRKVGPVGFVFGLATGWIPGIAGAMCGGCYGVYKGATDGITGVKSTVIGIHNFLKKDLLDAQIQAHTLDSSHSAPIPTPIITVPGSYACIPANMRSSDSKAVCVSNENSSAASNTALWSKSSEVAPVLKTDKNDIPPIKSRGI